MKSFSVTIDSPMNKLFLQTCSSVYDLLLVCHDINNIHVVQCGV